MRRIFISLLVLFGLLIHHSCFANKSHIKDSILQVLPYQINTEKAHLYHLIAKSEQIPDSIKKYAQKSLYWSKKTKDTLNIGEAYKSIGASYHLASSYQNALAYYDSALVFLSPDIQSNTIARTYSNKCGIFIKFRSLDSAIYNNEKCKEFAARSNDIELDQIYFKRKANILSLQGKHKKSINTLRQLLQTHELSISSQILNSMDIGVNYFNLGMTDSALYYYHLVDQMDLKQFPQNEIVLLNNKANVYIFIGDHEKSIKCYLDAIHIADSIDYEYGLTLIKSNLANLYFEWDKFEEAISIYKENLTYLESNAIYRNLSTNYINIGISYNSLNKVDSSLKYLDMAKNICIQTDDQSLLSTVYHNLGRCFFSKNEFSKALEYYSLAIESNKRDKNINTKANIYHDMALSFAETKKFQLSLQYIDSASSIYNRIENTQQSVDVEFSKAFILNKKGQYKEAYKQLYEFIELKDSVYSQEKFKQISELETKYKTAEKESEIQKHLAQIAANELEINLEKNKTLTYGILFTLVAIILLIILIFLLRNKQKHQLVKADMEQQRMELEGRLLRSQMNPHFIFNSLNSIQSYITSNDQYHAEIYLSKFAKLMRTILENSRHAFVSIEQDISNLMIYMELEELRFEGLFKTKIDIDESIDLENTYIPPMLIQPYIENAIIHGLVNANQNKGLLQVKFKILNKHSIKCTIEDNGIGRSKAKELKSRGIKPYKSLGMEVTKERMEVISDINKVHFEEKIFDIKDETNEAKGTRVELIIPFEKD